jgi:hypothetical protein
MRTRESLEHEIDTRETSYEILVAIENLTGSNDWSNNSANDLIWRNGLKTYPEQVKFDSYLKLLITEEDRLFWGGEYDINND